MNHTRSTALEWSVKITGRLMGYMSVHAHFKRGGGANVRGGGAYVIHSIFTDNQFTDVTSNRQDKSPTVTILGKE